MKEIILDTETTVLSTKEGHRIVEIGCIELDNLVPTKNRFHCYLNPDRKVSEQAFKVHGYTDKFLSKQKKFDQIVDEFLNFIKESRLVIHNAEFDLSHLNNELKEKNDLQKVILCDVQVLIYPKIEKALLDLIHNSGFPEVRFEKKIDFEKLYNEKFN